GAANYIGREQGRSNRVNERNDGNIDVARTLARKPRSAMSWLDEVATGWRRRLPVIVQTEAAECGLACLAMIAGYHGRRVDLSSLRRRNHVSLKGSTLKSLIEIARELGLATRAVRLELEDLGRLKRPCMLHWRMDHFVVLKKVGPRGVVIHDPASGARGIGLREASAAFTGIALELWPEPSFERRDERRRVRLRDLVGRVSGLVPAVVQTLLLAAVLEVFAVVSPLFLQWTIDHALVSGDRGLLHTLAIGFGLLVVLQQSIAVLRAWMLMHFGAMLNVQGHARTCTHLLGLSIAYFDERHLGDVVLRFRSLDAIQSTVTAGFVTSILDG